MVNINGLRTVWDSRVCSLAFHVGEDYMLLEKKRIHMSGKEAKVMEMLQLILIYTLPFFCSNIMIC